MATVQRRASNPVRLTGEFIRNESYNVSEGNSSWWEKFKTFMMSHYVANLMAVIVCVDTFCTCSEIDARAADGGQPSPGILLISDICLTLYSTEVLLLLAITGLPILKDWMMLLDLGIVVCGWVEVIIVQTITHEGLTFPIKVLRVLRLVRIFRPIRLLKRIRGLRELYKLSMMMATCFRTLAWCFLMCFVVMTGWAMLMVELVNPLVKEVKDINPGTWDGCTDCIDSMSSVMHANLLLFKTVIAGDSWGQIAVPLIQEHPETAIIFVGSLLTLVFGVVNLIVAVVVDTFADARQNDVQNLAEEMEDEIEHDRKALSKLFQRIDKDGSGQLTLRELIEGARHDRAFQSRLRVMDIDEHDLEQLFHMIDLDESGTIEISEFIGPLSRWAHDSKTAPRFIKYNMLQSMHLQQDLYDLSVDCFRELAARIDDVALQVHRQRPAPPTPAPPVPAPAFAETVKGPESGHETSQTDSTLDTEPHLWSKLHEVQQEANQMHGQSAEILGLSIEAIMVNLEAKLDMLLQESRKPRLNKSDSLRSLRSRFAPGPTSMSTDKYGFRRPLDPTAFRSLYMKSRSMRVPGSPGQDGGGSSESYNTFAARFGWPKTRFRTNEQDPSWTLSDAGLPVEKLESIEEDADDLKTMETSRI